MGSKPARTSESIKFGDAFEIDVQAYRLRRAGRLVKLERIPMELLFLLVEQRGQLVSREQIVERIWGKGVFFDADNSINGAIRKIRQVLRDDPEQPRFVQTITGKGYRFIAPVVEQLVAESRSQSQVLIEETPPPVSRRTWSWVILATATLLVAIGVYAARIWNRATVSKLTQKDTIVLADFVNTTGDPVFDDALKQALSVVLTQSPFLNVVSDVQVSEMLRRMGRTPNDRLTREVAREVCLRTGGKAILVGSISSLGTHYVVGLQALGCASGELLATGQAEAANKESVLKALDGVASQVRGKVGESMLSLEKYAFPLDTTTKSLEALKAFSIGQRALRDNGEVEAIPFFRQAIQLDPDFALAYTTLGRAYEDVGEDNEAVEDFTKAYELRNRLSERERDYITTLYSETVTGDMERAKEAGQVWTHAYPRDGAAREKLGTVYGELGDDEKAYMQFQEALRLDPESTINVFNSVMIAAALNRLDEAQRTLKAAQARGLDGSVIHESIYPLAFLRGDRAEMERQVAWATGKGDAEYVLLSQHSDTEAYFGRLRRARELSRRAVESATRHETKETAAICEIAAAFREIETGNVSLAGQGVHAALSLAPSRNVKVLAALVLAKSGDVARAKALTIDLENKNPFNTLIKLYWLPTLKASLELHAGKPQAALSLLQIAAPYELSQISNVSNVSNMYPAYVRGEAHLLAHNGDAAATEFKKLLAHRGIVQNGILGALSRLQLARAYVIIGDIDGAREQYSNFLSLWKDADSDIPILRQAKAEYKTVMRR